MLMLKLATIPATVSYTVPEFYCDMYHCKILSVMLKFWQMNLVSIVHCYLIGFLNNNIILKKLVSQRKFNLLLNYPFIYHILFHDKNIPGVWVKFVKFLQMGQNSVTNWSIPLSLDYWWNFPSILWQMNQSKVTSCNIVRHCMMLSNFNQSEFGENNKHVLIRRW